MAEPLFDGAVQVTVTVPSEFALAAGVAGVAGTVDGVTEFEGSEGSDDPTALVATTVNV